MNFLAYFYGHDIKSLIVTAILVALAIWLIFYVLPLPQTVRTILAVAIAVLIVLWLIPGCAGYQSTVSSRSVGVRAQTNGESVGGKVVYSVTYR